MKQDGIYKVVVVEDEPLILENIINKVEASELPFFVAGSAYNGLDALAVIDVENPDVVLTDIKMPMMDGLELIAEIRKRHPDTRIIILSGYDEFDYARQAIKYGVTDYLLKPLTVAILNEIFQKIYDELSSTIYSMQKTTLTSAINSRQTNCRFPFFDGRSFALLYICIGHKWKSNTADIFPSASRQYLSYSEWENVSKQAFEDYEKFWVLEERYANENFIVLLPRVGLPVDIVTAANKLNEVVSAILKPYDVTICTENLLVSIPEIWQQAQKLRVTAEEFMLAWKPGIIIPPVQKPVQASMTLISTSIENQILTFVEGDSRQLLYKLLYDLLQQWIKSKCTQKHFEKGIIQLLKIICNKAANLSEAEINHAEMEIVNAFFTLPDFDSFYSYLWKNLDLELFLINKDCDSSKEIMDNVENYIKNNFSKQINVESIAKKFNVHPSHLTRTFKRFKSISPIKYLINLRIDEAKKLMGNQPELDLKDISEIVGYMDHHYFSRIFKNVVGKTPSEFRNGS